MSKLLLIQDGKDAELETTLVQSSDTASGAARPADERPGIAAIESMLLATQGLSLQMKSSSGVGLVFNLQDAKGHSVELNRPLDAGLLRQMSETEPAFNAGLPGGLVTALASQIASVGSPPRPTSTDASTEEESGRRAEKQRQWSLSLEASKLQDEADRALLILKEIVQMVGGDPLASLSRLRLQSVLDRTVRGHNRHYPERTIELKQRSTHLALGYPHWVDFALSLLLDSAEKYTPKEQPFEVNCFDQSSTCSIALSDQSGKEDAGRFFSLWDLNDSDSNEIAAASGLSLSVGRQLIESMHGEFWFGYRKQGGCVFVVTLPRARPGWRRPANVISLSRKQVLRHSLRRGLRFA